MRNINLIVNDAAKVFQGKDTLELEFTKNAAL